MDLSDINLGLKGKWFGNRVANEWNGLSNNIVNANTLDSLKIKYIIICR